jgi:hypothetical protein
LKEAEKALQVAKEKEEAERSGRSGSRRNDFGSKKKKEFMKGGWSSGTPAFEWTPVNFFSVHEISYTAMRVPVDRYLGIFDVRPMAHCKW